jgi:hypothetical protein
MDPNITIKYSYGNFMWCGNNYDSKSDYYLFPNSINNNKILLMLNINMSNELYKLTDIIKIYDANGFLLNCSNIIVSSDYKFKLIINDKMMNTNLQILFKKILKNPTCIFSKPYEETILCKNIIIPNIDIIHVANCSFCNKSIDDDNKYIMECKHCYHRTCIITYFKNNNLLHKKSDMCDFLLCDHQYKPIEFKCIAC